MNGVYDIEAMKIISNRISEKGNEIVLLYKTSLISIIEKSDKCLKNVGSSSVEVGDIFKKQFDDFERNLNSFLDVLNNDIILGYHDLAENMKNIYNQNFVDQLTDLLQIEKN